MSEPEQEVVIVVTGFRERKANDGSGGSGNLPSAWYSPAAPSGGGSSGGEFVNGDGGTLTAEEEGSAIKIQVNIDNLTPEQIRAIERLAAGIRQAMRDLASLPGNSFLTLPNGAKVLASELNNLLKNAAFTINPMGTRYDNQTTRGEANPNGGFPLISLNIDVVLAYMAYQSGGSFLAMHEIAHVTPAMIAFYQDLYRGGYTAEEADLYERTANDIARAVLDAGGQSTFPATVPSSPSASGYSSQPLTFSSSGSTGGTDTGGGSDLGSDNPGPSDPGGGRTPSEPEDGSGEEQL